MYHRYGLGRRGHTLEWVYAIYFVDKQSKKLAPVPLVTIVIIALFYLSGLYEWLRMRQKRIFGEMAFEDLTLKRRVSYYDLVGAGSLFFQFTQPRLINN